MSCLLYTSRSHIGITSIKLSISYLPETLHILSCWEGILIQRFCPKIRVFKLRVGCWMMDYLGIWISCIMAHGIDVKYHIFIPNVTTGVQPLQWFEVMMASYLVSFLVGSKNFKVTDIEVFHIIWQLMFWWDNIVTKNKGINIQLIVIIKGDNPKGGSEKF